MSGIAVCKIQVAELRENLGGLPLPEEAADIWRSIWYEEAHHSTAIEGNTLILKEVQRLLDEGRAVGNKELREYMEVKGYADAADWVYRQAIRPTGLSHHGAILSMSEVRQIHHAAMTPVWEVEPHPDATAREAPGAFREHDIRPFPGGVTPVTWPHVHAEMTAWVAEAHSLDVGLLTFPKALASLHCRFEQIHPFLDGNGRTGRLVLNLILVRLAGSHLQAGQSQVPAGAAAGGRRRGCSVGRDARPSDPRQSLPLRVARCSRPGKTGAAGGSHRFRPQHPGHARGGAPGPTAGHPGQRRPLAQFETVGR